MPIVNSLFYSYYESDFIQQHKKLNRELTEYNSFLESINHNWIDEKKNDFFRKHIDGCNGDAKSYLSSCEKLITYIEEARKINED